MENNDLFKAVDINYPDEEEMKAAQLACCGRVCNRCETPAAYAWRKREVDLAILLEKAIEEELSEKEKSIVKDKWYNSLSFMQIAKNQGISPAAVKHTADRALGKLENALKYVVFYQRNVINESIVPAVAGQARVVAAARNMKPESIGQRIYKLRVGNGFSLRLSSSATGIPLKRISEIEHGCLPEIEELILLSEFFAVSVDCILKGENND